MFLEEVKGQVYVKVLRVCLFMVKDKLLQEITDLVFKVVPNRMFIIKVLQNYKVIGLQIYQIVP